MNKFTKLSLATMLAVGVGIAGSAMAAATTIPKLKGNPNPATVAVNGSVPVTVATATEMGTGNTVTEVNKLGAGKTKAGSVDCTGTTGAICTYTHGGTGKAKTDSFNYQVKYTDANGKARSVIGTVVVNITLPAASQ